MFWCYQYTTSLQLQMVNYCNDNMLMHYTNTAWNFQSIIFLPLHNLELTSRHTWTQSKIHGGFLTFYPIHFGHLKSGIHWGYPKYCCSKPEHKDYTIKLERNSVLRLPNYLDIEENMVLRFLKLVLIRLYSTLVVWFDEQCVVFTSVYDQVLLKLTKHTPKKWKVSLIGQYKVFILQQFYHLNNCLIHILLCLLYNLLSHFEIFVCFFILK